MAQDPRQALASAAWNFAQEYYGMLKAFIEQATIAYRDNDVREFWKWVQWLYDNVRMQLSDDLVEALDKEEENLEQDIYESTEGDQLSSLYVQDQDQVIEFRRQLRAIRVFYRRLLSEMQRKGMILPMTAWRDPSSAVLDTGEF